MRLAVLAACSPVARCMAVLEGVHSWTHLGACQPQCSSAKLEDRKFCVFSNTNYMDVCVTKASIFRAFNILVLLLLSSKCSHTRNEHLAESCMCLLCVALALFSLCSLHLFCMFTGSFP